jgi:hypothetical protein
MGDIGHDRIRRLAGRLRLLVWAMIVGTAAVYLAARIGTEIGQTRLVTIGASDPAIASPAWVQDLSIALVLAALWQLADMPWHRWPLPSRRMSPVPSNCASPSSCESC